MNEVLHQILQNYSPKCHYFSSADTFLESFKKRNRGLRGIKVWLNEFITVFNCPTFYTKKSYSKPLLLHELVNFCFDEGQNKYKSVNKFCAKWISKSN